MDADDRVVEALLLGDSALRRRYAPQVMDDTAPPHLPLGNADVDSGSAVPQIAEPAPVACTHHITPPNVPDQPDAATSATSLGSLDDQSTTPSTAPDSRVCRICLGEGDDDDQGRLLAPCLCRGTARHVHQACLRSWREADRKNSFYACGQCGATYRFRRTKLTGLLGGRHAVRSITVLLLLVLGIAGGFIADPLMRLADRDALPSHSKKLRHHIFDGHLAASDGIREAASTIGYLLGDCTWSSPREAVLRDEVLSTYIDEDDGETVEISQVVVERAGSTACAKRWARERDDEVKAGGVLRVLLHVAKGLATTSWVYIFWSRVLRQWILFAITIRAMRPRWGERLPFNVFTDLRMIGCSFFGDAAKVLRLGVKQVRRRGQILHWSQLVLDLICLLGLWACYAVVRDAARALVKRGLASVEDLVVDLDEGGVHEKRE